MNDACANCGHHAHKHFENSGECLHRDSSEFWCPCEKFAPASRESIHVSQLGLGGIGLLEAEISKLSAEIARLQAERDAALARAQRAEAELRKSYQQYDDEVKFLQDRCSHYVTRMECAQIERDQNKGSIDLLTIELNGLRAQLAQKELLADGYAHAANELAALKESIKDSP